MRISKVAEDELGFNTPVCCFSSKSTVFTGMLGFKFNHALDIGNVSHLCLEVSLIEKLGLVKS